MRSGKVQVVFRGFETATPDPHTFQTQQVAALAAGQQSHFGAARHDPSLVSQVNSEEQAGGADGIKGTPTLVFHGPKGSTQVPAAVPSYGRLQQVLQSVA